MCLKILFCFHHSIVQACLELPVGNARDSSFSVVLQTEAKLPEKPTTVEFFAVPRLPLRDVNRGSFLQLA